MKKLETKHLAPYLPYGLKTVWGNNSPYEMLGINGNNLYSKCGILGSKQSLIIANKPLLRPISDITNVIEHNGEKFIPNERLLENSCFNVAKMEQSEIDSFGESHKMDVFWSYHDCSQLISWHFDVFGLIEKGLAIDINTIKQ